MVNIVKTKANAEILFPTLERYLEVYPVILSTYLGEYKSNTEKRFIELQIEHFKTYCDEFLNNSENTFNKYQLERFYTDRLIVIEYLENRLKDYPEYINRRTKDENTKNKKSDKEFVGFINNVKDKEKFTVDLKKEFINDSGIDFKIIICLLRDEGIFCYTAFAPFYRAIDYYFSGGTNGIGSQSGLNDLYNHTLKEQTHYSNKIDAINNRLKVLIKTHKLKDL